MDLALVLMPALVLVFGPRQAVPIMAVAAIMANASRVAAWWREVDWRATAAYSVTGVQRAFFLAHGLVKGAYLGTEAMGSLAVYGAKTLTFRAFDALPLATLLRGLTIGASLMAGAFIAKRLVLKLDTARFQRMMDGLLLLAGATMLWAALRPAPL